MYRTLARLALVAVVGSVTGSCVFITDDDATDVLVVDETGVDCVLGDRTLCFDDQSWVIDDVTLAICAFNP